MINKTQKTQFIFKVKNPFVFARVRTMEFKPGEIVSEVKYRTSLKTKKSPKWGVFFTFWIKTKSISIEGNSCGFCLN